MRISVQEEGTSWRGGLHIVQNVTGKQEALAPVLNK